MTRTGQIEFNAWINSSGSADESWPVDGKPLARIFSLDYYEEIARIAHRGVFTNLFLSDRPQLVVGDAERPEHTLDPAVLLPAILARVPDIGGVITATTTYSEPYTLARQIQSANLVTDGRIGWNIVTSWHPAIAGNFSDLALPDRAARYRRAFEFVALVEKLWDSWQFPWDGAAGAGAPYYGTVAPIDFKGEFYKVVGPLNVPQAPGGRPFRVQAGGSADGVELAARFADLVYAPISSRNGTRAFRDQLRQAALRYGRAQNPPRLFPAISPIIVSSEAEADRLRARYAERNRPTRADEDRLAALLGIDLERTGRDTPLTREDFHPDANGVIPLGVVNAKIALALDKGLSLQELAAHEAVPDLIGTPRQIADFILEWWHAEAVDGFTISARYLPDDLALFVDAVIPLLQATPWYAASYQARRQQARDQQAEPPAERASA